MIWTEYTVLELGVTKVTHELCGRSGTEKPHSSPNHCANLLRRLASSGLEERTHCCESDMGDQLDIINLPYIRTDVLKVVVHIIFIPFLPQVSPAIYS